MKMSTSNSTDTDFPGNPSDVVVNAGVIISNLDGVPNALRGFMGTIDWCGNVIVGDHVHRRGRLQSWLTHFAVVVEFRMHGQRDLWLLERCVDGVKFRPFRLDFLWQKFQRDYGGMLCSVPVWDENFVVRVGLNRRTVWSFLNDQKRDPYHVVNKNCKHFVYDFFRDCVQNEWIQNSGRDGFPSFSEMLEKAWVDNGGW